MTSLSPLRLLLVPLLLFTALSARAQVEQGRYIVGLNAAVSYARFDAEFNQFTLNLSPSLLYLLSDDFALGGGVGLVVSRLGGDRFFEAQTVTSFGFAPAARYYFGGGERARFFVAGSAGILAGNQQVESVVFRANLGVGTSIFFNDGLAFEPRVELDYVGGEFGFAQLSLGIGLQGFVDAIFPGGAVGD